MNIVDRIKNGEWTLHASLGNGYMEDQSLSGQQQRRQAVVEEVLTLAESAGKKDEMYRELLNLSRKFAFDLTQEDESNPKYTQTREELIETINKLDRLIKFSK
jgi:hypothetical protein